MRTFLMLSVLGLGLALAGSCTRTVTKTVEKPVRPQPCELPTFPALPDVAFQPVTTTDGTELAVTTGPELGRPALRVPGFIRSIHNNQKAAFFVGKTFRAEFNILRQHQVIEA